MSLAGKTFPAFPVHVQPAILHIWQEAHDDIFQFAGAYVRALPDIAELVGAHNERKPWTTMHRPHRQTSLTYANAIRVGDSSLQK